MEQAMVLEKGFIKQWDNLIKNRLIPSVQDPSKGSYQAEKDKVKYEHIIKDYGWNTKCERNRRLLSNVQH